jgi:hypothetical protein
MVGWGLDLIFSLDGLVMTFLGLFVPQSNWKIVILPLTRDILILAFHSLLPIPLSPILDIQGLMPHSLLLTHISTCCG